LSPGEQSPPFSENLTRFAFRPVKMILPASPGALDQLDSSVPSSGAPL
jgi:hypothetical protein